MMKVIAALAILATTATSDLSQKGPVNTGPGTLSAGRKFLQGRWNLVSFEILPPGDKPIHVDGTGTLTYDGFGNLDVDIKVSDAMVGVLRAAGILINNGTVATSGRTVINMQARTLTYVFEGAPPPGAPSGPLAMNRPRYWEVEGNRLTLTTKGDDGQPVSIGRWEKAPAR